jgi:hypothetical protein
MKNDGTDHYIHHAGSDNHRSHYDQTVDGSQRKKDHGHALGLLQALDYKLQATSF